MKIQKKCRSGVIGNTLIWKLKVRHSNSGCAGLHTWRLNFRIDGRQKETKKGRWKLTGDPHPVKKIHGGDDVRNWHPPPQVGKDIEETEAMSQ